MDADELAHAAVASTSWAGYDVLTRQHRDEPARATISMSGVDAPDSGVFLARALRVLDATP